MPLIMDPAALCVWVGVPHQIHCLVLTVLPTTFGSFCSNGLSMDRQYKDILGPERSVFGHNHCNIIAFSYLTILQNLVL